MIGVQEHLNVDYINARAAWDIGRGLGATSLVAIIDSGIDMYGSDHQPHPEFDNKYRADAYVSFVDDFPLDAGAHGTHVAGLAVAETDNGIGIAGTGFGAWPMSIKISANLTSDPPTADLLTIVQAINYAADHGASVINLSYSGCVRNTPGCSPYDAVIKLLKEAVDRAYARGISIVVCAYNGGFTHPYYPAAFGQLDGEPWPRNDKLVMAIAGTKGNQRHPGSNYGDWVDFSAPYSLENSDPITSTYPTELGSYGEQEGTSMSAPQVAGLESLLTSLGYKNSDVWDFIKTGATDLYCDGIFCEGYDQYTGWGMINMGQSMSLAERPRNGTNPGMVVVPNAGKRGGQWFNFQGSGFTASGEVEVCVAPPGGSYVCEPIDDADELGIAGMGRQMDLSDPIGTWLVYMRDESTQNTTPIQTFLVE
jgi:thermitase